MPLLYHLHMSRTCRDPIEAATALKSLAALAHTLYKLDTDKCGNALDSVSAFESIR